MLNLGEVLTEMGEYAAARPLAERSQTIHAKVHGPRHRHTAEAVAVLASLLESAGEYAPARSRFEHALSIRKETLGSEHPAVGKTWEHLARLRVLQGDGDEAFDAALRAESIARSIVWDFILRASTSYSFAS
jgi:tetratricopeptide (TPR) repeat protein